MNRYELHVQQSPGKAALRLARARRRLDELEAGARPRGSDDTVVARRREVDGLTDALAGSGRCGDCGKALTDPESIERGIGPDCAAKRVREAADAR